MPADFLGDEKQRKKHSTKMQKKVGEFYENVAFGEVLTWVGKKIPTRTGRPFFIAKKDKKFPFSLALDISKITPIQLK